MENNTMINLQSSDGETFVVEKHVANISKMLQLIMEDMHDDDNVIPVNVTSNVLAKIIDYCKHHSNKKQKSLAISPSNDSESSVPSDLKHNNEASTSTSAATSSASESSSSTPPSITTSTSEIDDELKKYDEEFVKVEWETLKSYMVVANYMEIDSLLELSCQTAANFIKDKEVEEVRTLFGIVNDFTPEEEEAIRKEHAWAFEK